MNNSNARVNTKSVENLSLDKWVSEYKFSTNFVFIANSYNFHIKSANVPTKKVYDVILLHVLLIRNAPLIYSFTKQCP